MTLRVLQILQVISIYSKLYPRSKQFGGQLLLLPAEAQRTIGALVAFCGRQKHFGPCSPVQRLTGQSAEASQSAGSLEKPPSGFKVRLPPARSCRDVPDCWPRQTSAVITTPLERSWLRSRQSFLVQMSLLTTLRSLQNGLGS